MKFDIFLNYFDSSLKICYQIKKLAFIWKQIQKVNYYGNKTG